MIEQIERRYSYSMNRADLPVVPCPEPDEALEFKAVRLPMPRRRVAGEALVKFGRRGRGELKPALAKSASPFELRPRKAEPMKLMSLDLRVITPECHAGAPIVPTSIKIEEVSLSPKRRPYVGQEIRLDGKLAIITWLGETKFEVAIAGREAKMRLKYSDYPDLKQGQNEIHKSKREQGNVAS